jgi:hypothetical protein
MFKKTDKALHIVIEVVEIVISIITLIAMIWLLGREVYSMFTVPGYFDHPTHFLHNILTIVIGLEFVSMLINLTPANTIEVLILAISRYVIIDHTDAVSNIVCVICIAGLFAIRRFLIPKGDMKKDISGNLDDHHE